MQGTPGTPQGRGWSRGHLGPAASPRASAWWQASQAWRLHLRAEQLDLRQQGWPRPGRSAQPLLCTRPSARDCTAAPQYSPSRDSQWARPGARLVPHLRADLRWPPSFSASLSLPRALPGFLIKWTAGYHPRLRLLLGAEGGRMQPGGRDNPKMISLPLETKAASAHADPPWGTASSEDPDGGVQPP